jgi:excisionase family DNA binding protein
MAMRIRTSVIAPSVPPSMIDRLSTAQAASALGVTPERVLQFIRAGRLPAVKIAGVWLLEPGAVARFQPRPIGYPRGRPRK